jgi:alcohol dehydrogenase class IV
VLTAPAVFRFTAPTDPERHLEAARLMGLASADAAPEDAGDLLAKGLVDLMRATGIPNGLAAVGYEVDDLDALVAGALPQRRLLDLSPRPVDGSELRTLFQASLTSW